MLFNFTVHAGGTEGPNNSHLILTFLQTRFVHTDEEKKETIWFLFFLHLLGN